MVVDDGNAEVTAAAKEEDGEAEDEAGGAGDDTNVDIEAAN